MPEITPAPGDRTVVIHRFGVLTWISLAFNALILLLLLIGFVCHHHHHQKQGHHHGHGGWGASHQRQDWGGRGHGGGDFDRHDEGWKHQEGDHHDFGASRGEDRGSGGEEHHGFDMKDHQGWGGDRHDSGGHGPGDMGEHDGGPMTHQTPEAMTDHFMLMMTGKLTLTDAESAQIRPIVQSGIEQFQKDMEAQKAAHQKMIDDAKAKIRPILTPDQQKKFDAMTAHIGADKSAPASK